VFHQKRSQEKPLWDSGVRDALHQAAQDEGCDFPGLGPHSFRRASITWRQQVGGSAIEASRIAGHSSLEMTSDYTFVAPERQNELTRRIQQKLARAAKPQEKIDPPIQSPPPASSSSNVQPSLADAVPITVVVQ
jgi:integrase